MHDTELLESLTVEYTSSYPVSRRFQEEAERYLVDGGSHTLRWYAPYPFRVVNASGSRMRDADGHEILDFWQGHFANVLGHNPLIVREPLARIFENGGGLQTGIPEALEVEVARLLLERVGAEKVRFTTSGSLASMYAIMLARAFTGKTLILKVGGGWHGAQPFALKGVQFAEDGYTNVESEGLSEESSADILTTRFNDPDDLEQKFRHWGDRIACFIVEPWMGAGGFMAATPEYLNTARELTRRYEAVLIFDEVISGFRFCAGGVQTLYSVRPDLSVFGKTIGGGMPLAGVVGAERVMSICGLVDGSRVRFDGGTFSAHPAALLAGKMAIEYLVLNEDKVYPRLGVLGQKIRLGVEEIFARYGVFARCTGYGNEVVSDSSLFMVNFPYDERTRMTSPEAVWNPRISNLDRRDKILKLGLLLERVHIVHGAGAVSTAHSEEDVEWLFRACEEVAKRIKRSER